VIAARRRRLSRAGAPAPARFDVLPDGAAAAGAAPVQIGAGALFLGQPSRERVGRAAADR
jgi:hypothetical protein